MDVAADEVQPRASWEEAEAVLRRPNFRISPHISPSSIYSIDDWIDDFSRAANFRLVIGRFCQSRSTE